MQERRGWIEIVVGSMFSGKTEELIRRLRRAQLARLKVQVFKPIIDNRYHAEDVASHDQSTHQATPIKDINEIWDHLHPDTRVVGIDEGQFFSHDIVQVTQDLAFRGLQVIVAGLDMDWQGKPFEPMPSLMAIAENVTKHHAVCVVCGASANYTQRTSGGSSQVLVGSHDSYEARCRQHFLPQVAPRTMDFPLYAKQPEVN